MISDISLKFVGMMCSTIQQITILYSHAQSFFMFHGTLKFAVIAVDEIGGNNLLLLWFFMKSRCLSDIYRNDTQYHGPLTRYVKLRVAHMPGTFSPATDFKGNSLVSDPCMHQGTCVMQVRWCMSGSLTCGGGKDITGIPGACATRNFSCQVRDPWSKLLIGMAMLNIFFHISWNFEICRNSFEIGPQGNLTVLNDFRWFPLNWVGWCIEWWRVLPFCEHLFNLT